MVIENITGFTEDDTVALAGEIGNLTMENITCGAETEWLLDWRNI